MDLMTQDQVRRVGQELAALDIALPAARKALLDAVNSGEATREELRRVAQIERAIDFAEERRRMLVGRSA